MEETVTQNPDYREKGYIVYRSPQGDVRVNAGYQLQGGRVRLCVHYDRGLCNTWEEYQALSREFVESQAYGAWMDGAR